MINYQLINEILKQLEEIKQKLEERDQAIEILRQIIYASDGCQGHANCNHSMTPWKNARLFLDRIGEL